MSGFFMQVGDAVTGALSSQVGSGMFALSLVGALVAFCRNLPMRLFAVVKRRCVVQVDVVGGDPLFDQVLGWLNTHSYSRKSRLLTATSDPLRSSVEKPMHMVAEPPPILFTPAPGEHLLWHKGRPLWLSRERKEAPSQDGRSAGYRETIVLRMLGRDASPIRSLLEEARALAVARVRQTAVYARIYGGWDRIRAAPTRPLDSVILPAGVMEDLVDDIEQFKGARDWYARRGITYRRTYLLEGAPRSGKSSAIGALAAHLRADLYLCSLADKNLNDNDLLVSLLRVPEGSIVLLEDIDTLMEGRRMLTNNELTFSGVLNALDGVASQEGVLTFVTTNHVEKLDAALIGAGRVDRRITFGAATEEQAARFFAHFFERPVDGLARAFAAQHAGCSVGDLEGVLLRHKDDPEAAASAPHPERRDVPFIEVIPMAGKVAA